jgi:hypothetical protein
MELTLEFTSESREQLKNLEHQLKGIHGVQVFYVEPKDVTAPVLISLGLSRKHEKAELETRGIAHVLYDFVHGGAGEEAQKTITLVTIEGDSVDIATLSEEAIEETIRRAYFGE